MWAGAGGLDVCGRARVCGAGRGGRVGGVALCVCALFILYGVLVIVGWCRALACLCLLAGVCLYVFVLMCLSLCCVLCVYMCCWFYVIYVFLYIYVVYNYIYIYMCVSPP